MQFLFFPVTLVQHNSRFTRFRKEAICADKGIGIITGNVSQQHRNNKGTDRSITFSTFSKVECTHGSKAHNTSRDDLANRHTVQQILFCARRNSPQSNSRSFTGFFETCLGLIAQIDTIANNLHAIIFRVHIYAGTHRVDTASGTMNCRILILFGQNSICLSDQDRRNSQLILTTRRIPTTKDDGFRRQIKQRKQILQGRISRIRIWRSLGRGLTFVTANTDMAVKATMWKLIIIKNLLAGFNIIYKDC